MIPERVVPLDILDGFYAGATVQVSLSVGLGELFQLQRALAAVATADDESGAEAAITEVCDIFVRRGLRDWNLADPLTGEAIPPTAGGLRTIPLDLALNIIGVWRSWIGQAPPPLAQPPESSTSSGGSSTGASRRARSSRKTQDS